MRKHAYRSMQRVIGSKDTVLAAVDLIDVSEYTIPTNIIQALVNDIVKISTTLEAKSITLNQRK